MYLLSQMRSHALAEPDRLALVHNNEPVTYARFWRLIEGCQRSLAPHVSTGSLVLVCTRDLLENWIINLALRGLGVDTAALGDAQRTDPFGERPVAAVITVDGDPRPDLVLPPGAVHLTLSPPSRQADDPASPLPPLACAEVAGTHFMLTSGVTGAPKPVATRMGATAETIQAMRAMADTVRDPDAPAPRDVMLCLFDFGLWSAPGYLRPPMCWAIGAGVVLDQRGPAHLALEWPGVTHVNVTPNHLQRILAAPEDALQPRPGLRLAVIAGSISVAAWNETRRRLTSRIFINVGSTEGGLWARSWALTEDDLIWHTVAPDRIVQVIDEAGEPLPPGRLGEVRVALKRRGAASHLGDGTETAAAFGDDGWVYPGDLGEMDSDGRICLHGRASEVLNLNGVKIPTAPWERQLRERLDCDNVCIMSGRFGGADEELHVFVETTAPMPVSRLVEAVQSTLKGFAQAQVHRVDTLPRTPLGKVWRVELARRLKDGAFRPTSADPAAASG
jgi:acyl-coenzyme A synthetase/AMP-(fatty) acid ligase